MKVKVLVRESAFEQEVGRGAQDFRWLAMAAARRYAEEHQPANHPHEFTPCNVTDDQGRLLFPCDRVGDLLEEGARVRVDLVGPSEGLHTPGSKRQATLWEKYAYTPMEAWRTVKFVFDVEDADELDDPSVKTYGNFNRWGSPIPLRREGRTTRFQLQAVFPPGAEVCFKFIVDGNVCLSDRYEKVTDENGKQMNYFLVRQASADYGRFATGEDLEAVDLRLEADEQGEMRMISRRVVGEFEPVVRMTDEMRELLFEADWAKMQFADVVRARSDRLAVKDVLRSHYAALCRVYQFFSSHGSGDITYMSVMEWLHFCHVCKLPGPDCTTTRLDRIFRRVNIEEQFDEDFIEENPTEYRNAMRIVPDPFNPNNQFIRGEFLEALVRAAAVKLRGMPPAVSVEKLVDQHVMPYAMKMGEDDIRDKLLEPTVQQIYRRYARRLHRLFLDTAKLDTTGDQDDTTINLREFELLLTQYELFDRDISRRAAFSAFAMSQDATLNHEDNYEMVYGEFLEVIGRLSQIKFRNADKAAAAGVTGTGSSADKAAAGEGGESGDPSLASCLERFLMLLFPEKH